MTSVRAAAKRSPDARRETRTVSRTLLFADRNPDALELLRGAAERRGYRVVEAQDSAQALRLAREHRPDAVVVDLDLPHYRFGPGTGGVEVSRALAKEYPLAERPPVVLRVGRTLGSRTIREAIEAGVADCIEKACPLADLFDRIERHLGPRRDRPVAPFRWASTAIDELSTMPVRTVPR